MSDHSMPRSVRLGVTVAAVGVVFTVIAFVPFFFGKHNWPLWLNLLCMLLPVGAATAFWGALAQGRARQRRVVREVERLGHG